MEYVIVCWNLPNIMELWISIFLILCSIEKDSGQEQITLYLTMCVIFQNMDTIWPNTIVIDKINTKYKALMRIINKDYLYWKNEKIGGIQINYHILFLLILYKKNMDQIFDT